MTTIEERINKLEDSIASLKELVARKLVAPERATAVGDVLVFPTMQALENDHDLLVNDATYGMDSAGKKVQSHYGKRNDSSGDWFTQLTEAKFPVAYNNTRYGYNYDDLKKALAEFNGNDSPEAPAPEWINRSLDTFEFDGHEFRVVRGAKEAALFAYRLGDLGEVVVIDGDADGYDVDSGNANGYAPYLPWIVSDDPDFDILSIDYEQRRELQDFVNPF